MKLKICVDCGKECYYFSKKRCKPCAQKSYSKPKSTNKNSQKNNDYYKLAWDSHEDKSCMECGCSLREFNPAFISHILPKNVLPSARYDIRNHLLLCLGCHQTYEFGDRKGMKTYPIAQSIKVELMREYYGVKTASELE